MMKGTTKPATTSRMPTTRNTIDATHPFVFLMALLEAHAVRNSSALPAKKLTQQSMKFPSPPSEAGKKIFAPGGI